MATQLGLYRAALIECGEQTILASLTENRPGRLLLDQVYSDVVADCLQAGDWNFAQREVSAASDTGVTENFGFTETIGKPSDWVRTIALSSNESYIPPLADNEYQDAVDYWATNVTPIYVRYVSNDASYGLNLTNWPRSFTRYVELALANRIVSALSQNTSLKDLLEKVTARAKRDALNKDAMNEGQKKNLKFSTWNAARRGFDRRERGNPNSFTG